MKKIFILLLSSFLILGMTGCDDKETESDSSTNKKPENDGTIFFRCGNGNVNNTVYYEEYRMKDKEMLEFNKYQEIVFKTKEEMQKKYDYYKDLGIYKLEVINDTTLKVIDTDPLNVYELADSKPTSDEVIKDHEEDGDFCQVSKDGKTFEKLENNLSLPESERQGWDNSTYYMDEYDSEIIYTNDANITYIVMDGFVTSEKLFDKKRTTEDFKNSNSDFHLVSVRVSETSYYGYEKDGHNAGADSDSYSQRKHDLDYDERNEATEIKKEKVGKYNVYYYYKKLNIVEESAYVEIFFDLNSDYIVQITGDYKSNSKYDDVKEKDIEYFRSLIESFEIENIK